MSEPAHFALFTDFNTPIDTLLEDLKNGNIGGKEYLKWLTGTVFSNEQLQSFIREEEIHDQKILSAGKSQSLRSFSSGERKKALLNHLLQSHPDYIILINPFDNLDTTSVKSLRDRLEKLKDEYLFIQCVSRKSDVLPFIEQFYTWSAGNLQSITELTLDSEKQMDLSLQIPAPPPEAPTFDGKPLVRFSGVSVSYEDRCIVRNIDWTISPGEFWELKGPNGSGKSTLLTLITGDNPKAYGQDITLFGHRKGSGESVWELKKLIGYFTPSLSDRFKGYHSVLHMIISGLTDSIGLYVRPTDSQLRLGGEWLNLLAMEEERNTMFHRLSEGKKRLVLCARAMIKHPPLLILDEPTAGLDDYHASLFVALVNKMASESRTTLIFVSHRQEPHLKARKILELKPGPNGSTGKITP